MVRDRYLATLEPSLEARTLGSYSASNQQGEGLTSKKATGGTSLKTMDIHETERAKRNEVEHEFDAAKLTRVGRRRDNRASGAKDSASPRQGFCNL